MIRSISYGPDYRVAVILESGTTIQFVAWDLEESKKEDFEEQLRLIIGFGANFEKIQNHMKINGFVCELEDIYEN